MGLIKIEGKEVSIDDDIINAGTPAIRAALSVDFPDVENADIEVVTPTRAGAPRTASVVKRGTGKGAGEEDVTIVTCDICDEPTDQVKTGRCDRCWDLLRQIQASPERARRALAIAAPESAPGAPRMPDKMLEVGTTGAGEVVLNHPDLPRDERGVAHIIFSPEQARNLAQLLNEKAEQAAAELS